MSDLTLTVRHYRPAERNTRRAFLKLEIPAIGLVIDGCVLHEKAASRWVSLPSRSYEENGVAKWVPIVDFTNKQSRAAFQEAALRAVDDHHPSGGSK